MDMTYEQTAFETTIGQNWCNKVFAAKAVKKGGIVRRAVRDIDKYVGRDAFLREVKRRGFHLIEVGDQYVVICNTGRLRIKT